MSKFLFGLGLAFGLGLLYAIWVYPVVGLAVLAIISFLLGGALIGGVVLLNNRQWIRTLGQMPGPRVSHSYRYPEFPNYPNGQPQLEAGGDPWEGVEVIDAIADDGRPVA